MLINLSNHPSALWEAAQLKAAHIYGEVEDMPFPVVEPEMSTADVARLAETYAEKLLNRYGTSITVHVMGEMTFTYQVVCHLKAKGICCVASTTERMVQMASNLQKVSEFQFVQFREY